MKLTQAVRSSQMCGAYRVVGAQRILVEVTTQRLRVLIQYQHRRHWMLPDHNGGVRYLNGVLREIDGSWVVACGDLAALENVAHCLPTMYKHLLTPDSNDWQPLPWQERKQDERCPG